MRHDIGNVDAWPGSLANFASKAVVMTDDYDNRDDLWKSYHACMAAVRACPASAGLFLAHPPRSARLASRRSLHRASLGTQHSGCRFTYRPCS